MLQGLLAVSSNAQPLFNLTVDADPDQLIKDIGLKRPVEQATETLYYLGQQLELVGSRTIAVASNLEEIGDIVGNLTLQVNNGSIGVSDACKLLDGVSLCSFNSVVIN